MARQPMDDTFLALPDFHKSPSGRGCRGGFERIWIFTRIHGKTGILNWIKLAGSTQRTLLEVRYDPGSEARMSKR